MDIIEKEMSWLSFNYRVLQEAMDPTVPLIERLRFLGIYSNNLDEFFRVRVADIRRLILFSKDEERRSRNTALMSEIQKKVLSLHAKFEKTYQFLEMELRDNGISMLKNEDLTHEQNIWVKNYFREELKYLITPLMIHERKQLNEYVKDDTTYLVITIHKGDNQRYALIEIPSKITTRFIQVPNFSDSKTKYLIILDDVIRSCLDEIFSPFFHFDSIDSFAVKLIRDASFKVSSELDQSQLYLMTQAIKQRLTASPIRLVYDKSIPPAMKAQLENSFELSDTELLQPGGRYLGFSDFIGFPNLQMASLENRKMPTINSSALARHKNIFDAITAGDIILNYPYHKFSHFSELIRQSAYDPQVRSISITLYRVAKNSKIVNDLIVAVKNGKKVRVVIELKARFDEQANIRWAKQLSEAGAIVLYGGSEIKVHAKICLIKRKEGKGNQYYCHVGTGNFNESTAKIYTDFSLLTKSKRITDEVVQVFKLIKKPYLNHKLEHLIVSPYNTRERLYQLIEKEIVHAKQGEKSGIFLKLNNLVDSVLIDKLYGASNAGVKVKLLVRGMCILKPGLAGLSENIEVRSIVDRFLEHSRVLCFYNKGDKQVYLSSADWMERNLDGRVEVSVPLYDEKIRSAILDILQLQWHDNCKSRIIEHTHENRYQRIKDEPALRSQMAIHDYWTDFEESN